MPLALVSEKEPLLPKLELANKITKDKNPIKIQIRSIEEAEYSDNEITEHFIQNDPPNFSKLRDESKGQALRTQYNTNIDKWINYRKNSGKWNYQTPEAGLLVNSNLNYKEIIPKLFRRVSNVRELQVNSAINT